MVCGYVITAALLATVGIGALPCAAAPTLEMGANRDTITVGDRVTLRVRVRRAKDDRTELLQGSGFPSPLELLDMRTPSVRQLKDGRTEAVTDYVVTAYRTGDLEVAPLALWFLTAEGDSGRLSSDAVRLVVRSVLPENESDIRDIRGPVEMRTRVPLWLWLGLAVLVAAVFVLWRYFRRRRGATVQEAESPPVDWYAELEKIGRMGLLDRGEYKKHYSLVSDVVRRHLEGRAGVEAMESTTFEVAWRLRQTRVSETYVSDLEGFLADADLVKFAKMRPPEQAALAAVDRARDLMRRIEREHRSPEADEDGVAPAPTTGPTP